MSGPSEVLIPIGGILDVTGEVVAMWVLLALLAVLSVLATRNMKERPGRFQNMVECGIEYLDGFFSGIIGKHLARKYFFFLGSLFIFIITANYAGLIPGVGLTKYFAAPTSIPVRSHGVCGARKYTPASSPAERSILTAESAPAKAPFFSIARFVKR